MADTATTASLKSLLMSRSLSKNLIYVKDEDGLYTANPKTDRNATLIPSVTVDQLIELDLPDLIVERPVLELMKCARFINSLQVINHLRRVNAPECL